MSWAHGRRRAEAISAAPFTPVVLNGSIVRLEPMTAAHSDALAEIGNDPQLWLFTTTRITGRADAAAYVQAALAGAAQGAVLPFVTVLQSGNRIIGSTRFANYDRESQRVEIGWTWVAPPWQRSGANVEAKLLMMTHAFEQLGCNRVEFKTDVLNEKSRRALLGIGAVEEGILRQHARLWHGRVRDSIYYSVLLSEWPVVKQALQEKLADYGTRNRVLNYGTQNRDSATELKTGTQSRDAEPLTS